MFDLAKFAAGPMFIAEPGQWIEWCETQLNYEPFSIKQSRWLTDAKLTTLELPKPDAVNFTMMNNLLEYANMLISPSTYNQIASQSRSATDSEYRREGLKTQLNDLADSYGIMFDSMLKDYVMYAKKSLSKHEVEIMNIEWGKEIWKKINAASLEGNFVYETEFESMRDLNAVIDRSQYMQLLDVVTRVWQDPVTGKFLVNMKKFLTEWLELFDQDTWILLDDEEYANLVKKAQIEAITIQSEMQKLWQKMGNVYPGDPGTPEAEAEAAAAQEQWPAPEWSQVWWAPEWEQNMASILKQVQE